jgi:hypothetical protein
MQDFSIIDPQFSGEKLFHCKMEIMEETGVVNDASMINVSKTDFDGRPKSHG